MTADPSRSGKQWASDLCSGKRSYFARRGAKVAVKRLRARGGKSLGCYWCGECGHWHVGHRPKAVIRGVITKDQWLTPPR